MRVAPLELHHNRKYVQNPENYTSGLLELMLDRYGLGYICENPVILFAMPNRIARSAAYCRPEKYRVPISGNLNRYVGTHEATLYRPEDNLDRMAEAYRILDQIYAPWPALITERYVSQMVRCDCLSDRLY